VDNLSLTAADVSDFFRIESLVRSSSLAEQMGLAPVAAQKIVMAFGGEMTLVKNEGNTGAVIVTLPCHADV
jgi:signal transduction histidine kinase